MKRVLIALVAMLFAMLMISCGDSKDDPKTDNEVNDEVVEDADVTDDVVTDDDTTTVVCTLDATWMTPKEEWVSWGYLKMMGEIGEYDGAYVEAVFADGKIQLADVTKELLYGGFQNYQGSVLIADVFNYEFININESALTATIDYWGAMYQFSQALIPAMKEQSATEAGFGASVWFRHTFIDVDLNASGQVTAQRPRKSCFVALGNTEEVTEGTDTYDVPIGDMYGCFAENIDGSVGENLKMMFKNEFTEDEEKMLEYFNTKSDGITVVQYGEEGYTHLCSCYNEKGASETEDNEVNCWNEYDGPGGVEECPAVVEAAGECGAVEPDEDVIDEDIIDEDVVDDDPYVDPCTPTNTCVEAHKTVCTDANTDGVAECACDADYHLNGSNVCISDTKSIPCDQTGVTVPANAAIVVENVDVNWTGAGWEATPKCEWACDEGYSINMEADGCDQDPV